MNKYLKVLSISIFLYLPFSAAAWSMLGHRIVGKIAENHLSKKAGKAVKRILGDESLAMASTWGDFIKSDPAFDYMYNWHFVNLPSGLDRKGVFDFLETDTAASVYSKVPAMITILKDKQSTNEQKVFAMRMLVHLVGDLNQPMHTARKEDLGGNKVYVTWFGEKSNLHKVWDDELIDYQNLGYLEYVLAIDHPTKDQLSAWKSNTLKDFVYDSYKVCNKIYENTKPDAKLSYKYNFDFVSDLNEQLLKGGMCLANILNDIYK